MRAQRNLFDIGNDRLRGSAFVKGVTGHDKLHKEK